MRASANSALYYSNALCWHLALPDRLEASDALVVISTIVENIDQSELTLKAPWCGPELLGKVVDCVDLCGTQIRYLLERMEVTTHINLQYVSDLLSGAIHNMHSKRDELNKYFTEYAVTQHVPVYRKDPPTCVRGPIVYLLLLAERQFARNRFKQCQ